MLPDTSPPSLYCAGRQGTRSRGGAVIDAPDLETVRTRANELGRNRHLAGKVGKIRTGKAWKDAGDLKRALMDMLMQERNETAKRVMLDIEGQRQARRQ